MGPFHRAISWGHFIGPFHPGISYVHLVRVFHRGISVTRHLLLDVQRHRETGSASQCKMKLKQQPFPHNMIL